MGILTTTLVLSASLLAGADRLAATHQRTEVQQSTEAQKLFESGRYQALLELAAQEGAVPPEIRYLAGLGALRMKPPDEARARALFETLVGSEEDAWTFIGRSALAAMAHEGPAAVEAAQRAAALDPSLVFAHYQLGLAQAEAKNWPAAGAAFEKAASLQPTFAYAHYGAGMASYQTKRIDRMAAFFDRFLKLAPEAPERPAIEALLRTVRR